MQFAKFCINMKRFRDGHVSHQRGSAAGRLRRSQRLEERRPVDLHLKGLAALGADVRIEHGYVVARVPDGRLRGAEIHLVGPRGPTVTGTANVMMAATLAAGETVLTGVAMEPEIVDLGHFLN